MQMTRDACRETRADQAGIFDGPQIERVLAAGHGQMARPATDRQQQPVVTQRPSVRQTHPMGGGIHLLHRHAQQQFDPLLLRIGLRGGST